MNSSEPTTYLIERIRAAVAASEASQLGVQVDGDDDHIVLRGPVDGAESRNQVVGVARSLCGARRVIDELDCDGDRQVGPPEQL
ncbi:MAG: BON domain-containing protein [Microthrixaceae bacterium]